MSPRTVRSELLAGMLGVTLGFLATSLVVADRTIVGIAERAITRDIRNARQAFRRVSALEDELHLQAAASIAAHILPSFSQAYICPFLSN